MKNCFNPFFRGGGEEGNKFCPAVGREEKKNDHYSPVFSCTQEEWERKKMPYGENWSATGAVCWWKEAARLSHDTHTHTHTFSLPPPSPRGLWVVAHDVCLTNWQHTNAMAAGAGGVKQLRSNEKKCSWCLRWNDKASGKMIHLGLGALERGRQKEFFISLFLPCIFSVRCLSNV